MLKRYSNIINYDLSYYFSIITYLDESSSGRKGLTKNVPAKNPAPITACIAIVKGLDRTGPIV